MIIRSFVGTTKFVWSEDPALDKDADAYDPEKFKETGDLACMPAIDGGQVTVFEIQPLRMDQFIRALALDGLDRCKEAIAYGLKGVTNFRVSESEMLELKTQKVDGVERLNRDTLNKLFEPMLFLEMGERILELSRLHPPKGSR